MRIQVNPDVQAAGGFPLWAEGRYTLRAREAQQTTASTGKAQLKVIWEPTGDITEHETTKLLSTPGALPDYVTIDPIQGKSGGMFSFLRGLWEAAGLPWGADIELDDIVGREVVAIVAVEKDQRGNDRNRVKRYVKAS